MDIKNTPITVCNLKPEQEELKNDEANVTPQNGPYYRMRIRVWQGLEPVGEYPYHLWTLQEKDAQPLDVT